MTRARDVYYRLKPYLPWSFRMAMRRIRAARLLRVHASSWPISESAGPAPAGWPGWPDGKSFALVLTHDVEGPDGLIRCRPLMDLEARLGFRSSFNFVPEGTYAVPRELREHLVASGFEVCIHDLHHDGKLYSSREEFRERAKRINRYLKEWRCKGFRSGFMLHNLEWLHDLDAGYDMSTFDTDPFEPQPDGTNTIFPFYVAGADGSGYVELPYTLPQDSTLFLVLRERTPETWFRKLDWVAERGGMALVNVHPDYLRFEADPPSARTFPVGFYEQLLRHARERHGQAFWHPLPGELAAWYRLHGRPQRPSDPPVS